MMMLYFATEPPDNLYNEAIAANPQFWNLFCLINILNNYKFLESRRGQR